MNMTFNEAMTYIEQLNKAGSIYGLERIRTLVDRLGHPEQELKIIHIAGTNGKGSFGAFLGSILMAAGYTVGRYVSPVIDGYCEKIQINGQWMTENEAADMLSEICNVCDGMQKDGLEHPTVFEIETAMAFLYFQRQHVDFVLLEVGLGGGSDSTNVIDHSILSVLTSISLDHTAILGNTIEAIAKEKAGIIKKNQAVLSYEQYPQAARVIKNQCGICGAALTVCDWADVFIKEQSIHGQKFDYKTYKDLCLTAAGTFQIYNAAAAVEASLMLQRMGFDISKDAVYEGLKKAKWPGRFELLCEVPMIIVDGAHNPDGAHCLAESIEKCLVGKNIIYVAGVFADKDYEKVLEILSPYSDTIYTHTPPTMRGLSSEILAHKAGRYYKNAAACENIASAVVQALDKIGPDDAVVAFGSLSTIKSLKYVLKVNGIGCDK